MLEMRDRGLCVAVAAVLAQDAGDLPGGALGPRPHHPPHLQETQQAGGHRGECMLFYLRMLLEDLSGSSRYWKCHFNIYM